MADKIIITNVTALKAKYGSGLAAIKAAIKRLAQADQQRGLKTILVAINDPAAVTPAVQDAKNAQQAKAAIDAVYRKYAPDYLMILGAGDVVPHVPLRNPVYSPGDDDDRTVPSDLPYACDAPYSTTISDFLGPTRVIGRLPDLNGGSDPAYLIGLLETTIGWKSRPASDYQDYFGITASVWKGSTGLSLQEIFGNSDDLKLCPPGGSAWPSALLKRRAHFINCHGSPHDPQFYGQRGTPIPFRMKPRTCRENFWREP